jgi:oligoendopeptidase F
MAQENTNGQSTENKGPNMVQQLHEQWEKNGSKQPPEAVVKALVKTYKEAQKARDAAEEAFNAAKHKESQAVQAIILNCGKGRVKIGGKVLIPMSKGDSVYFRSEGGGEVRDLG